MSKKSHKKTKTTKPTKGANTARPLVATVAPQDVKTSQLSNPSKTSSAIQTTKAAQTSRVLKSTQTTQMHQSSKFAKAARPVPDLATLTARVERLERKINSNERFARTFVRSVLSQTSATEAIRDVIRHSFREDVELRKELYAAMDTYDKRRFRKLASGFTTILLWAISIAVAVFVGAFVHWVFYGIQTK